MVALDEDDAAPSAARRRRRDGGEDPGGAAANDENVRALLHGANIVDARGRVKAPRRRRARGALPFYVAKRRAWCIMATDPGRPPPRGRRADATGQPLNAHEFGTP